ncbi:hypothetical protein ANTRET_LOCUS7917 [Anthophora retusa]
MLKGYIATAFLFMLIRSSFSNSNECDYICDADGCKTSTSNPNNMSPIKFCTYKDVPANVNFSMKEYKNGASKFPVLQINFKPPKKVCKYEMVLLANELVNEKECMNYSFQNFHGSETHTRSTICFVSNEYQYQNNTEIFFPYIFTACYSIQFFFGKSISRNTYLKTNYKHTEITNPAIECTYDIVPDSTQKKKIARLEIEFSIPLVTAVIVKVGLWSISNGEGVCAFNYEELLDGLEIFKILHSDTGFEHHNFSIPLLSNGKYKRTWKYQTEVLNNFNYCIHFWYHDLRCKEKTLWKPSVENCWWYRNCQHVTDHNNFAILPNTMSDDTSNLYSPIIIITLTIFVMIVIMYVVYIICVYNVQDKKFYINICNENIIKTNETKPDKSNMYGINEKKEKLKCRDTNSINTDIILLYPKGSESFMALMTDFREILSRVCQCVVHDWYDRMEWNYVAEVGAFDWFAEMLQKQSCVIWIDIPTMRSLITQKFKNDSFFKRSEECNYVTIGDFRDVVFPTVFNLSKRNIVQSMIQRPKHFIVRLQGFQNFENDDDPFVDLSPRMRYFIPQDLNLLCSDLSVVESNLIVPLSSQEEDLIKQRLHYINFNFCK